MLIRGYIRRVDDGSAVPDGTAVAIRRHVDDSLISTAVTVGGMYELVLNGSPGPYYIRAAIADEVHISSSKVVGMSGPLDVGNLPLYFRGLWSDGYIAGFLNESSVYSSGAGMAVLVRSGVHLVKGVLYDQPGEESLTIDAPDTQPRIDTVVIEVMVPGSGPDVEGRTRLVVKKGTPAASPVAPSLTQTTGGIWEHPLANITVDPGVSSIASNKVADVRVPANVQISNGYIDTDMIADGAVNIAKITTGTLDARYYTEAEVDLLLSQRRPKSDRGTYAANQTVSTAGTRQPTQDGVTVGDLGFSGLLPSTQYTVEVSVAMRITGGPTTSLALGYSVIGASTSGASTDLIPVPDNANYLTWTWNHVNTSSPGGAITVRPMTTWGVGTYTVTWVSISARLDLTA